MEHLGIRGQGSSLRSMRISLASFFETPRWTTAEWELERRAEHGGQEDPAIGSASSRSARRAAGWSRPQPWSGLWWLARRAPLRIGRCSPAARPGSSRATSGRARSPRCRSRHKTVRTRRAIVWLRPARTSEWGRRPSSQSPFRGRRSPCRRRSARASLRPPHPRCCQRRTRRTRQRTRRLARRMSFAPKRSSRPTKSAMRARPGRAEAGRRTQRRRQCLLCPGQRGEIRKRRQNPPSAPSRTRHAALLGGQQPVIRRKDLGSRGIFYGAQVGPFSREAAVNLCQDLKAAGRSCMVQN